jgi:Spy/CpxP family protein refolding chaperone
MMHGAGPVDQDGIPDGHEAHGTAAAAGTAHGSGMGQGMGGCKMMGGRGGTMSGGHSGHDAGDAAFHRDLMTRIDRMENRLILMETLLRERLKTP